ncbi:phage associated protein [Neisseria dentiae]|nr:phage associated protein [Neisseria dentiae]STZ49929.1 phage associated protein [Neisseria dentiae]
MVLLALCDHANDDGVCYPSQDKLSVKCSMAKRTIVSHIQWLEERRIITHKRRQNTQRRQSNLYQITLENYSQESKNNHSACANSACANSACANSACANSAPESANFAPSESANFAPSYYIEEPSVFNHQEEPSVVAPTAEAADAPPPCLPKLLNRDCLQDGDVLVLEAEAMPSEKPAKQKTANPDNTKTWEAYRQAYLQRYGVEPIRNAQANALIANLVKAVGGEEAPMLAWFYVSHNKGWYVQNRHALKHLIADVQAVRTDWLRNEQMTTIRAKQAERKSSTAEAAARLIAKYEAEGVQNG